LEEIQLLQLCDLGMAEVQISVSAQHQALGLKGHHRKVAEQPRFWAYVTALHTLPELFNLQNAQLCTLQKLLSPAVDMWSYGCVVYEAAAGKPLMKLAKPVNASAQRGVAEWCQHYKQMCGKGYQKMLGQNFKTCFPARLSVHDCWAEVILNACAPEPMLRHWKQAVVKSV
jgi:serine/threonine protein kinase